MTSLRYAAAASTLLMFSASVSAEPGSTDHYALGVQQARAGAYATALTHFQSAFESGEQSPALVYNLGVVNYHLGRFEAARDAFIELTTDPRWRGLAYYNLGLVADAAGYPDAAREHFRHAHDLARQPKLRTLAAHRLEGQEAQPVLARWHGLLSIGAGYDDNVILADDRLLESVSNEDDYLGEVLAAARRPLSGSDGQGWTLGAASYFRGNASLNDFDFGALSGSLAWQGPLRSWDWSTGVQAEAQFAGGDPYASVLTHRLGMERGSDDVRVQASNNLSYVFGQTDFDYVTGWRNRTRVQLESHIAAARTRIGYEFELNEREDLSRDPEFFSYSPRRHMLYGAVETTVVESLVLEAQVNYRRSDYQDDNHFVDHNGDLVDEPRDQDVTTLGLRASYPLSDRWNAWSQLEHVDSRSDIATYDYTSTRYLVGVERLF